MLPPDSILGNNNVVIRLDIPKRARNCSQFPPHRSVMCFVVEQANLNGACVILSLGLHLVHPFCPNVCRQDFDSLVVGVCSANTTFLDASRTQTPLKTSSPHSPHVQLPKCLRFRPLHVDVTTLLHLRKISSTADSHVTLKM